MTLPGPSRPPRSGGAPKQLVILVHGYGAFGSDLMPLTELLAEALPDAEFHAPDAPDGVPGMPFGRQWFPIDAINMDVMTRGARAAGPRLDAYIDAKLAELGLTDKDLALVGFSQGAMLSLYTGLRRKAAPAAIVAFSGALPDPTSVPAELACKPPVFMAHGEADEVVPSHATKAAAQHLADNGLAVVVHLAPDSPHTIAMESLQMATRFLRDAFAGQLNIGPGLYRVHPAPTES